MADGPRDARADIAEAVTLVARAAGDALDRVGQVVGDAVSGLVGGSSSAAPASQALPEVLPLHPVEGGAKVSTRLRVVNSSDAATEPFTLTATDLVSGDGGARIPADAVSVAAAQRVVAAGASDTVLVTIEVPADAAPGVYSGELQPSDSALAPAALTIEVR